MSKYFSYYLLHSAPDENRAKRQAPKETEQRWLRWLIGLRGLRWGGWPSHPLGQELNWSGVIDPGGVAAGTNERELLREYLDWSVCQRRSAEIGSGRTG